jgi:Flp pilus assembly CpaF family ATPase
MNEAAIQAHVKAINDCNQRGGRMLSLVDLIDAGTVDLPLAAYLAATMRAGASLLVGAQPGGAGKTAVMCALLNFLPDRTTIRPVDSRAVLTEAQSDARPGHICYLAHEISPAHYYYAYIWGSEARDFFALVEQGHTIASNLHADTLAETQDQLCRQNGVARIHLDAVTLKIFLHVERARGWSLRRRVSAVYESDGTQDRLLWTSDQHGTFTRHDSPGSALVSPAQEKTYTEFLATLHHRDIRHIDDVRRRLVRDMGKE